MQTRKMLTWTAILSVLLGIWPVSTPRAEESSPVSANITAHKFDDLDQNGTQGGNERNLAGWPMRIYRWEEWPPVLIAEGETNDLGDAAFANLEPGRYKVWEANQECWEPTTPGGSFWEGGYYQVVELAEGESVTVDFGNAYVCEAPPEPGSITSHKYHDLDKDSIQDADEENLASWPMRIYRWEEWPPILVAEGETNDLGKVTFSELDPGRYKVWEADQECWEPTTPGGSFWEGGYYKLVDLEEGESITINFGNLYTCGPPPSPSIDVDKSVSVDNKATWHDADAPPGPEVQAGSKTVWFKFVATNDGNVALTNIKLKDSDFDGEISSQCTIPDELAAGDSFECEIGSFEAVEGQHVNTGTAMGDYGDESYSATDRAHFFGSLPEPDPTTLFLDPDEATNELPIDTAHQFTASVVDQYDDPIAGVTVSLSTNFGHFESNNQYLELLTNGSGQISVTIVSTMTGVANIRAWVDDNDNDEYNKDELTDQPSTKTWVSPPPCLQIRKILDGAFTNPIDGQDLETGIDLIHVSDGENPGWTTRFSLAIEVENCGPVDLTSVVVTDVIERQMAPRTVLTSSGGLVEGLRPHGDDEFGLDIITWTIGSFPVDQPAHLEILVETLQNSEGKYAPTSRDQDMGINGGAAVRAMASGFGGFEARTEGITLTLKPTDPEEDPIDDGHISWIIPSLPYPTPWAEANSSAVGNPVLPIPPSPRLTYLPLILSNYQAGESTY